MRTNGRREDIHACDMHYVTIFIVLVMPLGPILQYCTLVLWYSNYYSKHLCIVNAISVSIYIILIVVKKSLEL